MREWKPGDVAVDEHGRRYLYVGERMAGVSKRWRGADGGNYWGDFDLRPLVVIDPESDADVTDLRDAYNATSVDNVIGSNPLRAALRELANPTPPKPDEPMGLGAVVEDASGRQWVGVAGHWRRGDDNVGATWETVRAVRVLSEGVQ